MVQHCLLVVRQFPGPGGAGNVRIIPVEGQGGRGSLALHCPITALHAVPWPCCCPVHFSHVLVHLGAEMKCLPVEMRAIPAAGGMGALTHPLGWAEFVLTALTPHRSCQHPASLRHHFCGFQGVIPPRTSCPDPRASALLHT